MRLSKTLAEGLESLQARRHIILSKGVAAVHAIHIGDTDAAVAITAGSRHLISALRAEVKLGVDTGSAGGTLGHYRLAKEEVEYRPDAARHGQANRHPQARAHGAARR